MSAMGDKKIEERDNKRRFKRQAGEVADYATVDRDKLVAALQAVSSAGGALRFGYSRDGNVYAVGVLGDGEPYTEWATTTSAFDDLMADLTEYFQDMERPAEKPRRQRKQA